MSFTVQTQLKEERGKTKNSLGIWYSSFEQQQSKLLSLNLHRVEKSYQTDWIGKVWIWVARIQSVEWHKNPTEKSVIHGFFLLSSWIILHWDLDKVEFLGELETVFTKFGHNKVDSIEVLVIAEEEIVIVI